LLFAGDAQWGNWENFLYGGKIETGRTTLTDSSKTNLASLDFYKVGHHGSTIETPKDALNAMREGAWRWFQPNRAATARRRAAPKSRGVL
jgi:hypothetical protein